MLMLCILLGHFHKVRDRIPPGLQLDVDLTEGILHFLIETDEIALGTPDIKSDQHQQGDYDYKGCHGVN